VDLAKARSDHRLIIHSNNAKLHTLKRIKEFTEQNNLRGALHSPFSPDLASSDFGLFDYVKAELQGTAFMEKGDLCVEAAGFGMGYQTKY
jgi:hypothetical protein